MPLNLSSYLPAFVASDNKLGMDSMSFQKAIGDGNIQQTAEILHRDESGSISQSLLPNGESALVYAIRMGKGEVVKLLLQSPNIDLSRKDDQGLSPVDHAALAGDKEILSLILTKLIGQNVKDAKEQVNHDPQCMKICFELHQRLEKLKNLEINNLSELHQAAFNGDLEKLKAFAAAKTNFNRISLQGYSPLHCAVIAGKREAVEFLLQAGADEQILTLDHESVLHLAALRPNTELLSLLLQKKLDVNKPNKEGFTPLHYASTLEQHFNAQYLVQNKADPLKKSTHGLTPLAVLAALVHQRSEQRDPMKIDLLQTLMFTGIVCSALTSYFSAQDPYYLATAGGILSRTIPLGMLLNSTNNIKQTAAVVLSDAVLTYIPGVNVAYQAFKTCFVAKTAWESLRRCWRNTGLELARPLRNGIISAVNLTHSLKSLADTISPVLRFVLQPGMFARSQKFIPECLRTNTTATGCFDQFEQLESVRSTQGIRWELGAEGIEERFKQFSPICSQELKDAQKCEKLFWQFEQSRYLEDVKWENFFASNLIGRAERLNSFNQEVTAAKIDSEFSSHVFEYLENKRYLEGIPWENSLDKMSIRYKEFMPKCKLIDDFDEKCLMRFYHLETLRYLNGITWETQYPGVVDRWNMFTPICDKELSSAENPGLCKELFFKLEDHRYINKLNWEAAWQDSIKNSGHRFKQFTSECESLGSCKVKCDSQFIEIEADRITSQSTQEVDFGKMADRWGNLQSAAAYLSLPSYERFLMLTPKENIALFWDLEKSRANQNVKWEENLAGIAERSAHFHPKCKKSLNGLELKNLNRCGELFKVMELFQLKTGKKWEENWKENADTLVDRWKEFNAECSNMMFASKSCEQVFWDILEPNFHSNGIQAGSIAEMGDDWNSLKKECSKNSWSMAECESKFFHDILKRNKEAEAVKPSSCAPINPKDLENKTPAEIIVDEKLDPQCQKHAEVILGLNKAWERSDCKDQYKNLIKKFHPDKATVDKSVSQKITDKLYAAKKTLCA